MALELTYDYHIPAVREPGFQRRYESRELVRSGNTKQDSVSNKLFWKDHAFWTLMLKPQQLEGAWLNSALQLPYLIRLADMQANPTNISSQLVIEKAYLQNSDNPWIFHGPISPTSGVSFVNSPEQVPGQVDLENHSGQAGSVTSFPSAAPLRDDRGRFAPTVAATDMKVIVWSKVDIPWNMPLYLRWWIGPNSAGHQSLYDFNIGQFCLRVGADAVEVFRDTSVAQDRSSWVRTFAGSLFAPGPVQTTDYYSEAFPGIVTEQQGEARAILWLPYSRNYVYLESSKGKWGVFQANDTPRGNNLSGSQLDWAIVEPRKLIVAGLTPGPGWFQVQKLAFPSATGEFDLPPFTTDYLPSSTPDPTWLVDDKDTPQGSSITHTTPTSAMPYTFRTNTIDNECPIITTTTDGSNQLRTYQSQYFFSAGTDPTNPSLKTYTPMLYRVNVEIAGVTAPWPVTSTSIQDVSQAAPSARIKRATFSVDIAHPGRFEAEVEDLTVSLAALYRRTYYPLQFANDNGFPLDPLLWTTLWLGIADPQEVRELRLDVAAPREIRTAATDFSKWLAEQPARLTKNFRGTGHVTVMQTIMQLAGISTAGWDGPAAGSAEDTPLGGLNTSNPAANVGDSFPDQQERFHPTWAAQISPPDSYWTFLRRIADIFAGWDFGFHADGTPFYHRYDYYTNAEMTFYSDSVAHPAGPLYHRPSVELRTVEPDANFVQLVSGNHAGSLQYSSPWVDYGSIYLSTAPNFIGKVKALILAIPGAMPCTDLNRCARAVFTRARRRHALITFHATYVPTLRVGHCFNLDGESGVWRLQGFRADYARPNWDNATYTAELVEAGYV